MSMRESGVKMADLVVSACPHYNANFSGYCEDCGQKTDCMLKTILTRLASIEARLAEIKPT